MNLVKPLFDLGKKEEKSFNLVGLNHTADLFIEIFCWLLVAADSRGIHAHTYTFVN